jgi:hypothetical protein
MHPIFKSFCNWVIRPLSHQIVESGRPVICVGGTTKKNDIYLDRRHVLQMIPFSNGKFFATSEFIFKPVF